MKSMILSVFPVLIFCIPLSTSLADLYSVDFESTNGGPTNGFGAAHNEPSVWNVINFADALDTDVPLVNSAGTSSGVQLNLFSQAGGTVRLTNPGFTGDAANLLTDSWATSDIPNLVTVKNLEAGIYRVTIYGLIGDSADSTLRAAGNVNNDHSFIVGGFQWNNDFVSGESHQDVFVTINSGEDISILMAAANFGGFGAVSGIQIKAVPEPSAFGIAAMSGLCIFFRKRH